MGISERELLRQLQGLSDAHRQLSDQLNSGQAQMRGLARRVWQVQERERKQLARELHDGVGQLLTALINQLQLLRADNADTLRGDLLELARRALQDTRELSRLMRPRILDDLGLPAALQWLVRVMGEPGRAGAPEISLAVQLGEEPLDESLQTLVFRVVQEALTNAVRHAAARRIEVRVVRGTGALRLEVDDDGRGFEPGRVADGFGLSALRDRVTAFGGDTEVDSAPGKGCRLMVRLPGGEGAR